MVGERRVTVIDQQTPSPIGEKRSGARENHLSRPLDRFQVLDQVRHLRGCEVEAKQSIVMIDDCS
jgi:hypothetical protein